MGADGIQDVANGNVSVILPLAACKLVCPLLTIRLLLHEPTWLKSHRDNTAEARSIIPPQWISSRAFLSPNAA